MNEVRGGLLLEWSKLSPDPRSEGRRLVISSRGSAIVSRLDCLRLWSLWFARSLRDGDVDPDAGGRIIWDAPFLYDRCISNFGGDGERVAIAASP